MQSKRHSVVNSKAMSPLTPFTTLFSPHLILPILLMILLGCLVVYLRRKGQQIPSLRQSLRRFKINLVLMAVLVTIAAAVTYTLTATLNDSGYPNAPEDVQTAEQILIYLQQYNRAIMTNTYVLLWFFYGLTVWFLTALYAFAKAVVHALLIESQH
ncbi:MAG: hypothetical protein AAFY72_01665 [Cyanobacteria bacterium J06649_4]